MQLLSNRGRISLSATDITLLPDFVQSSQYIATNYETLSLKRMFTPGSEVIFLELTAQHNDCITIINDQPNIIFQLALKNSFAKMNANLTEAITERHYSIYNCIDQRIQFDVKKDSYYSCVLIMYSVHDFESLFTLYPNLSAFLHSIDQFQRIKLHSKNPVATSALLVMIEQLKHCINTNSFAELKKNILLESLQEKKKVQHTHITEKHLEQIYRLTSFINNNYAYDYSIKEFIKKAKVSEHIVNENFRLFYGISINNYVNEQRVLGSIRMLLNRNRKIYNIAAAVGFKEVRTFARIFKKLTCMLPKDFRDGL